MVYRLSLIIAFAATMTTMAHAQSRTRQAMPAAQQQIVQPGFPAPAQHALGQLAPAQQVPGQQVLPGQGQFVPQQYYNNTRPLIGSGLVGAQKDGCNCFQLPDIDPTPPYDPYASKNYWNLCPPATRGTPRPACAPPRYDFNRFIPRPTQPFFRR